MIIPTLIRNHRPAGAPRAGHRALIAAQQRIAARWIAGNCGASATRRPYGPAFSVASARFSLNFQPCVADDNLPPHPSPRRINSSPCSPSQAQRCAGADHHLRLRCALFATLSSSRGALRRRGGRVRSGATLLLVLGFPRYSLERSAGTWRRWPHSGWPGWAIARLDRRSIRLWARLRPWAPVVALNALVR